MQFEDIIGQHTAKQQLRAMVNNDHLPHALLLVGPSGCGKLALALALAQYLLCQNRSAEEACGQCSNCTKASKWIHPDIHFSFPTVGSKVTSNHLLEHWRAALHDSPYLHINHWFQLIGAENKQGNINKDECVSIIKKLSLKTFEGSYKILIMWMPEYLGKEGNRLLKLIEEPPEQTVFLLVAEQSEQILNTILSRCQSLKIKRLQDQEIITALQQKYQADEAQAMHAAHLADGDFSRAIQLLREETNDQAGRFVDWMRKCYRGNGVELVRWCENLAGTGREYQKHFLQFGLHFLQQLLQLKISGASAQIRLGNAERQAADKLKDVIHWKQLEEISMLLNDCAFHIERNANPKIRFLDASIRINHILKQTSIARLQTTAGSQGS